MTSEEKNMKKFNIQLLFLLLFAIPAFSQESSIIKSRSSEANNEALSGIPDEILKKCSTFFETLIARQTENALNVFLKNSPVTERKDQVQELIFEIQRANKLYGDMQSYEPVSSEIVTSSYIRVRYLSYHNYFPMRWILTFYKSPAFGWITTNIKYDDMSENFFRYE